MKERRFQTTDDVIARAAQGEFAPGQPSARFRGTGWVVAGCIAGALVILIGLALTFG